MTNQSVPNVLKRLETMSPAYFALVMATGIVSMAFHFHGYGDVARGLFFLNLGQYLLLWSALILRMLQFPNSVLADAKDHLRAPGFFTLTAGTGVLSVQCYHVIAWSTTGMILAFLTAFLWMVMIYGIFVSLIVRKAKPDIVKGINGGWLVAIVATQSVSIVSTTFAQSLGWNEMILLFGGLMTWCFGVMLYIWIISMIVYRYMFFALEPDDLSPPYWINMGAVAISTLAGCGLIAAQEGHPLILELLSFIKGLTFLLWSTATWWIPMLLMLGYWRHVIRKLPLRYDPLYWGLVFPLGMYSVCTFRLSIEFDLLVVRPISTAFLLIGFIAWLVVFSGMVYEVFVSPFIKSQTVSANSIICEKDAEI